MARGRSVGRWAGLAVAVCVAFVVPPRARGQQRRAGEESGDAARLERLEALTERLQDEVETLRAQLRETDRAAAQGEAFEDKWGTDVVATWKDGFQLLWLDPNEPDPVRRPLHELAVHGRLHLDYRLQADRDNPRPDTFRARRIRLSLKGFLYRSIGWSLDVDLANDGGHKVRETWVNLGWWKPLQLRVGSIKMPFGLEQRTSSRFLNFVERPQFITVYDIDFDLGAMAHGDLGFARYHVGVFNGARGQRVDTNSSKDVTAHVLLTPFRVAGTPVLEWLGFGAWGSHGHRGDTTLSFKTASGLRWLDFDEASSGFQRGDLSRFGAEAWLGGGPLRLQAEWAGARLEGFEAGNGVRGNLDVRSWYVDVLYMLTGENHPVGKRVVPRAPFDPLHGGWGAWQVGARYEEVRVDPGFVKRAARRGTDRVRSVSCGLNWYLTRSLKLQANYVRNQFRRSTGLEGAERHEDLVLLRLAIDF